jgi:hypothetical protein
LKTCRKKSDRKNKRRKKDIAHNMNVCEKLEEKFQNADIEKKNMKKNLIKKKIRILRS